jgi:hypothetical protein
MRKARIKNIELVNDKIIMVREGSNEKTNKMEFRPGAKWKVKNFKNIKELELSDVKYSSKDEIGILQSEYERIHGVSGYQTGASSPAMNDTATGVSVITFEANKLFNLHRQLDETMGIERLGDLYMKQNMQFLRKPEVVRIEAQDGYEWKSVGPEELLIDYDMYAVGSSRMVNKQAYFQQMMGFLKAFNQDPFINQFELRRQILEASDIRGHRKLLKTPRNDPQAQAAQQGGQLMLPGMGGGQGQPAQNIQKNPVKPPGISPSVVESGVPAPESEMEMLQQIQKQMGGQPKDGIY